MKKRSKGEIVIYKPKGQKAELQVRLEQGTVWLDARQIAKVFGVQRPGIVKHINNILKPKELSPDSTCSILEQVAADGKTRKMKSYNLDMIISVGYRVNSKRATRFRVWATQILKDHIIKGYSINEKRLKEQNERLLDLQKTVSIMGRLFESKELDQKETAGLLKVITDYSHALTVLDHYDRKKLKIQKTTRRKEFVLTYNRACVVIERLGKELKRQGEQLGLFGQEKDESFKGSLGAIYQTFDGEELYSSIEEKAAHLLYFVTKNHSFVDGNKRIAAILFIWYLDANGLLYTPDGRKRLGDNALVALTLMIAGSNPRDKDLIVKVIVNLINKNN